MKRHFLALRSFPVFPALAMLRPQPMILPIVTWPGEDTCVTRVEGNFTNTLVHVDNRQTWSISQFRSVCRCIEVFSEPLFYALMESDCRKLVVRQCCTPLIFLEFKNFSFEHTMAIARALATSQPISFPTLNSANNFWTRWVSLEGHTYF